MCGEQKGCQVVCRPKPILTAILRRGGFLTMIRFSFFLAVVFSFLTAIASAAPNAPTGLTSSSITVTSFTLKWTAATGGSGTKTYQIFKNGTQLGTATTTSYNASGLTPNTSYSMTVKAVDTSGTSVASSALAVKTLADTTAPAAPTALASASITATSFTLSWTASTDDVAVTGYDIYKAGVLAGSSATTSFAVTGLLPGTAYSMTVKAKDAAGNISPASTAKSVTTTADTTVPSAPTNLASSAIAATSFTLTWTASTDNIGVTSYVIYNGTTQLGTATTASYNAAGLIPNTTYSITVKAKDAAGNTSTASSTLSVKTLADTTAPTAPTALASSAIGMNSFTLTWTASSDNVGVAGYTIYNGSTQLGTATASTFSPTGLAPNTTYNITVKAKDAAGNVSAASTALAVKTLADTVAPSAPTALASSAITTNSFTLKWTASTDNVGVTSYTIFNGTVQLGTATATSYNATGLTPNTTYSVTVKANDAAGNTSAASSALAVTTSMVAAVAPSFSPAAGTYSSAQIVTISSTTGGASIAYTTDGTAPTESGGVVTHGTLYSAPITINVTTNLKAIAFNTGYADSAPTSGTYTIKAATPFFSPGGGTFAYIPTVTITSSTTGAKIAYTTDASTPTEIGGVVTHGTLYTGPIDIAVTTTLKAIAFASGLADSSVKTSTYTLNLPAADAPILFPTPGTFANAQTVAIESPSEALIAFTTDDSTPTASGNAITHGTQYTGPISVSTTTTIKAICFKLGNTSSPVVSGVYTIAAAAAAPIFSPAPGTYSSPQSVSITSATSGATIMYTTDGSTPTETHGTLYTSPLSLNNTVMLKAITYVSGSSGDSTVTRGLYAIGAPIPVLDVLHDFTPSDQEGIYPTAGMVQGPDGNFYGTTSGSLYGTIYKITPNGTFTTLVTFNGTNGSNPTGVLTLGDNGDFYGISGGGGPGGGTIFKMTQAGVLTSLYQFSAPPAPSGPTGLIKGNDGNFYGTTRNGGTTVTFSEGPGTLFKMTPLGGFTVLLDFNLVFVNGPCGLIQAKDGLFYGALNGGFFKTTPEWSFNFTPVADINSTLVQGSNGGLDGTTILGGDNRFGTVFLNLGGGVAPPLSVYFSEIDGKYPNGPLFEGSNGNFYGTTEAGGNGGLGTIFKVTPTGSLTSLFSFNGQNGSWPTGLTQAADGRYYGVTYVGGIYNRGTVFRLLVPAATAPVFNPAPDVYRASPQLVAISTTTPGASIYYTTDGTTPSAGYGTIYSGPISLDSNAVLKAIACAEGLDDSPVTSGNYSLIPHVTAPVFTPAAGTFFNPQVVSITSTTGATIRYTTDGTTPTETHGTIFSGLLNFTATTTLRAFAYKEGCSASSVTTAVFLINEPPVVTPVAGVNGSSFSTNDHVTVKFNAQDGDGAVSKVEIYREGTLIATLTSPSVASTWSFTESSTLPRGTYTYSAVAYDIQGTSTTSSNVTINVVTKLPYFTDFESSEGYTVGALDNQLSWEVAAGTAQITDSTAAHEHQSVLLNAGTTAAQAEQVFSIRGITGTVYVDFYVKPVVGTVLDCDFGRVTFVQDGAVGRFMVFQGNQLGGGAWRSLPLAPTVALDANQVAATWQRVTLRFNSYDYYDVYLNGHMVAYDLPTRISRTSTDVLRFVVHGVSNASSGLDDLFAGQDCPLFVDTNGNGIDDAWEVAHGWSINSDGSFNRSRGVQAFCYDLDPAKEDTDGDGLSDSIEIKYGFNPTVPIDQELPQTGRKLWLDAASCTSGPISSWTDRANSTLKAQQSVSAKQPTAVAADGVNYCSVVRFDGVDDSLTLSNIMSGASAGEILGVVRVNPLSSSVVNRLWSFGMGSGSSYYNVSRYEDFGTNEDNPHTASPCSSWYHITDVSIANSNLTERVNGVVNWSRGGAAIGFNPAPVIGASADNPNVVFSGDIAEILIYNRELTPIERLFINRYFALKYKLDATPAAPSLSAEANDIPQVSLSWSASSPTLYTTTLIERRLSNGDFITLAEVEQGTTYIDSSVVKGCCYSYRVKSKGLLSDSGYSNTVSLIVPVATAVISSGNLSSMSVASGTWAVEGSSLVAKSVRGALDCNLPIDTAGIYALDVTVRDAVPTNGSSTFSLEIWADGIQLGTLDILASGTTPGTGRLILPWLTAGNHVIRLVWHNGKLGTFLCIDSLKIVSLDPTDSDRNGEPDWMAPYFASTFSLDGTAVQSCVSPYTVEGGSAYPTFVQLNYLYQTTPVSATTAVAVRQGLSKQFFADIPLNSSAPTKVTAIEANGLRTATKIVTWQPLNLISPGLATKSVRTDSRMLVTANDPLVPGITYQLRIVSPDSASLTSSLATSQQLELLFDQVGDYQLYLTPAGGIEYKALTVSARQLSLSPVPVLFVGGERILQWGNLPPESVIQSDILRIVPSSLPTTPQTFSITANATSGRAIIRLDGTTGFIVDAVAVEPIRSYNDELSTSQKVATLPDGTGIYRLSLSFEGPIPSDLRIVLRPFTGATFSDGSLEKIITASDIGIDGRYEYFLYVQKGRTSTCHNASLYIGNGDLIYSY